jgi:hypothetical protein
MTKQGKGLRAAPLPPGKNGSVVRVGKLNTLGDVRRELGRLYRAARRTSGPELDAVTASKLAYLLNSVGRSLEAYELEKRIAALEACLEVKQ